MSDEKSSAAEGPKKSNKLLFIVIALVVLLGGGGAGAFFMLGSDKAEAKPEPKKGIVTAIESDLTINLADGHYLKLGFALQETEEAGAEAVDTSEAINLAIDQYTGKSVAELSTEKGRETAKSELLEKIKKAYQEDGTDLIMDIYYTAFVTQ